MDVITIKEATMRKTINHALKNFSGETRWDEPLAPYTSLKVGGPADILISPRTIEEATQLMRIISLNRLPYCILGGGSNLLIKDGGIEGVVIYLKHFRNIKCTEDNHLLAEGGVPYPKLAIYAMEHGLSGLEFAAGIPGTVGGAVMMNAGIPGKETASYLETITLIDTSGRLQNIPVQNIPFTYRKSNLQRGIIHAASFRLSIAPRKQIEEKMRIFLKNRHESQPLSFSNCGSVFKNPDKAYAGALIEQTGLKGLQIGGAEISEKHGNFILNRGSASAKDCLELIKRMREAVAQLFGISLELEVKVFGRD